MLTILLILGGVGIAALGGIAWVFAIGTATAAYELHLTLHNASGQPLGLQQVQVWRYDYPTQQLCTDSAGQLVIKGNELFGANILTGPHRPDAFLVRLAFPGLSPLFYRFEVRRDGPVPYQIFNTTYDYEWGQQWVGDFEGAKRVRSQTQPDRTGKVHATVPPTGGQTRLWQATAALQLLAKLKAGSRYAIELNLQQSGLEQAAER